MIIDNTFHCSICGKYYESREVYPVCPNCHMPVGSMRCPQCQWVIIEADNFCPHCGMDRRWIRFECPGCGAEVTAHRRPGLDDDDKFFVTCIKCGCTFRRPDVVW